MQQFQLQSGYLRVSHHVGGAASVAGSQETQVLGLELGLTVPRTHL
jgi:hypothetical protein